LSAVPFGECWGDWEDGECGEWEVGLCDPTALLGASGLASSAFSESGEGMCFGRGFAVGSLGTRAFSVIAFGVVAEGLLVFWLVAGCVVGEMKSSKELFSTETIARLDADRSTVARVDGAAGLEEDSGRVALLLLLLLSTLAVVANEPELLLVGTGLDAPELFEEPFDLPDLLLAGGATEDRGSTFATFSTIAFSLLSLAGCESGVGLMLLLASMLSTVVESLPDAALGVAEFGLFALFECFDFFDLDEDSDGAGEAVDVVDVDVVNADVDVVALGGPDVVIDGATWPASVSADRVSGGRTSLGGCDSATGP
jgi:hypothetical protein